MIRILKYALISFLTVCYLIYTIFKKCLWISCSLSYRICYMYPSSIIVQHKSKMHTNCIFVYFVPRLIVLTDQMEMWLFHTGLLKTILIYNKNVPDIFVGNLFFFFFIILYIVIFHLGYTNKKRMICLNLFYCILFYYHDLDIKLQSLNF